MTTDKNIINICRYHSPCGDLILGSLNDKLCLCDWEVEKHRNFIDNRLHKELNAVYEEKRSKVISKACKQLDEYFHRRRTRFNIPLLFVGTDFQKRVWQTLLAIPYGAVISYGQLAALMQIPNSYRAVANANAANTISIFVPCHRVIGRNCTLGGYGGGLETKLHLLLLEDDNSPFFRY